MRSTIKFTLLFVLLFACVPRAVVRQPAPSQTPVPSPPVMSSVNAIIVNPELTYQTMTGWEATAQAGQGEHTAKWLKYKDALYDQAINDLGINRVRLELQEKVKAGAVNWPEFEDRLDKVVVPLRNRLAARGESLWVNVCIVGSLYADDPDAYSAALLQAYAKLRQRGITPDSVEAALEPDVFGWGLGDKLGRCIVAAAQLLARNGYPPRVFVAPSSSNIRHAIGYYDEMVKSVPAVEQYILEVSYHTYAGASPDEREDILARANSINARTMHGERIGATYEDLHADLKLANVSSWQQYTLAWVMSQGRDNGGHYYVADDIANPTNPPLVMGSRTRFLRQYFKFVRRGAVRVGATGNATFDPVAFRNQNGSFVVVVKASASGLFMVTGLPAGTYGIKYTTAAQYDIDAPNVTIRSGQTLSASIPAAGVITVYSVKASNLAPRPS